MNTELKYKDLTEKIIGASFEVHKFLGNGFQEVIYQRALAYELSQAGLAYAREIEQQIFYKNLAEPIGTRRADFVVEGKKQVIENSIKTRAKNPEYYKLIKQNAIKKTHEFNKGKKRPKQKNKISKLLSMTNQ